MESMEWSGVGLEVRGVGVEVCGVGVGMELEILKFRENRF
jgi:hypothetical protein